MTGLSGSSKINDIKDSLLQAASSLYRTSLTKIPRVTNRLGQWYLKGFPYGIFPPSLPPSLPPYLQYRAFVRKFKKNKTGDVQSWSGCEILDDDGYFLQKCHAAH